MATMSSNRCFWSRLLRRGSRKEAKQCQSEPEGVPSMAILRKEERAARMVRLCSGRGQPLLARFWAVWDADALHLPPVGVTSLRAYGAATRLRHPFGGHQFPSAALRRS